MAKIKVRPLDDRVVIRPAASEEVTAGGIVLPDSAKEKPQRGEVVAVGSGRLLESGDLLRFQLKSEILSFTESSVEWTWKSMAKT